MAGTGTMAFGHGGTSAASAPTFDSVIAPCTREAFLRDHFNRQMLVQHGDAGRFHGLLDWSDLDRVLETSRLEPPRLQLVRRGKHIDADVFTRRRAGVRVPDAGATTMLLSSGATMVLSFAEELFAPLRALADDVEEALGAHVNVNLYAGWKSDAGFDMHFDKHDVLVLQVRGRKRWRVFEPEFRHPVRNDPHRSPRPKKEPEHDFVLEDGDMLFLPRGWWHEAIPLDEASLHATVAILPPTARDLLTWLADRLESQPIGRRDMPPPADAAAREQYLAELRDAIAAEFDADLSECFAEAREAQRIAKPTFRLGRIGRTAPPLDDTSPVRLASDRRLAIHEEDGEARIAAGGREWVCHPDVVPALRLLRSFRATPYADLRASLPDPEADRALRQQLAMFAAAGVVFTDARG